MRDWAQKKMLVLARIFHKYLGSFQTVEFVRSNPASIEGVLIFSMGRMGLTYFGLEKSSFWAEFEQGSSKLAWALPVFPFY